MLPRPSSCHWIDRQRRPAVGDPHILPRCRRKACQFFREDLGLQAQSSSYRLPYFFGSVVERSGSASGSLDRSLDRSLDGFKLKVRTAVRSVEANAGCSCFASAVDRTSDGYSQKVQLIPSRGRYRTRGFYGWPRAASERAVITSSVLYIPNAGRSLPISIEVVKIPHTISVRGPLGPHAR